MSREKNLERLKASLRDTQDILGDLVEGTSKDASKRLHKANKRLEKTYNSASHELEDLIEDTSKDVRKQYESTRKDLDRQAAKAKDQIKDRYADTRASVRSAARKAGIGAGVAALAAKADLGSKAANAAAFVAKTGLAAKAASKATDVAAFVAKTGLAAKAASMVADLDLKSRTANLLEGAAGSFVAARNKLDPDNKVMLRSERDRDRVSKAGYFLRFSALAIVIISKRHKLMELGTQLYDRLKDSEGRAQLTQEAKDQFDTMRRLINAYANGQYREFPYRSLVKIVAAVVYFVSVADLIPDFIPLLGLTDDLAILAWVFSSVKDDLQQFVDWEAAEEKRRSRLAKQTQGGQSDSSRTETTGSVANVGNATAAPDRKASPNVTTNTGDTGKATVTTGTSGTTSGSTTTGGSTTGSSSTGTSTSGNLGGTSSAGNRTSGGSTSGQGGSNQS